MMILLIGAQLSHLQIAFAAPHSARLPRHSASRHRELPMHPG